MEIVADSDGDWPELNEWPSVQADVTCRTPGCPVEGVPFRATLHGNTDGVYRAWCGPCNTSNEDIVIVEPARTPMQQKG